MEDLEREPRADKAVGTPLFVKGAFHRRAPFPAKIALVAAGVTLSVLAALMLPWLAGPPAPTVKMTPETQIIAHAPQLFAGVGFISVAAMTIFYLLFRIYAKRAYRPYQQAYEAMVQSGMSSVEARLKVTRLWRARSLRAK